MEEAEQGLAQVPSTASQPPLKSGSQPPLDDQGSGSVLAAMSPAGEPQLPQPEAVDSSIVNLRAQTLHEDMDAKNARRTVYLHVGMHKTATTYIQNKLRKNTSLLQANGIVYPPLRKEHLALVKATKDQDFAPWLAWLEQARTHDAHLLVSAEALSIEMAKPSALASNQTVGAWLCQVLQDQDFDVRLIAFVRDQPSYLNSRYTQLVKRLHTTSSFGQYVHRVIKGGTESECDMMSLFGWTFETNGLESTFVPFGATVTSSESTPSQRPDPFEQLQSLLPLTSGLQFAAAPSSSANQQPGQLGVRLARRTGRYLQRHHPDVIAQESCRSAVRDQIERWSDRKQWQKSPFNGLTPELWDKIRHRYAQTNDTFACAAWGSQMRWSSFFADLRPSVDASQESDHKKQSLKPLFGRLLEQLNLPKKA